MYIATNPKIFYLYADSIIKNIPLSKFTQKAQDNNTQKAKIIIKKTKKENENNKSTNKTLKEDKNDTDIKSKAHISTKPKLAIIIDDVATKKQFAYINDLSKKITLSIFPPNNIFPNTNELAKNSGFYMIHLPLEAISYKDSIATLKTNSTKKEIESYIKKLKKDFPNVHYINNHTGSKFTADEQAMRNLLAIIQKYGYKFLDSKTTDKSISKKISKELHMNILSRDTFIDNKKQKEYIKKQLKKSIQIAQKKGYAIAIGHPLKVTADAIRELKELNKVELVYINELYEYLFDK